MIMSEIPIEMPALVASANPSSFNLSSVATACGGLDSFGFSVSVDCLLTQIWVLNPDAVVCVNASVCLGKFNFRRIAKERQPLNILTYAARILREIIAPQRNVLGRRGNGL